jgi:hypothetical protein
MISYDSKSVIELASYQQKRIFVAYKSHQKIGGINQNFAVVLLNKF